MFLITKYFRFERCTVARIRRRVRWFPSSVHHGRLLLLREHVDLHDLLHEAARLAGPQIHGLRGGPVHLGHDPGRYY